MVPPPNKPSPPGRFDRDPLFLPECVIDDFDAPVARAIQDAFHTLYRSVGGVRSGNYDEDGNWTGQPL